MKISYTVFRKLFIAFSVVTILSCILYYYWGYRKAERLFRSGIITNGYVVDVFDGFRSKTGFNYVFSYQGKRYKGKGFYLNVAWKIRDSIFNRPLPVLFLPNKPSESRLLLNEAVFESSGRKFPDSLLWLKRYL